MSFELIARLPLLIEGAELVGRAQETSAGWTRRTTEVVLHGGGCEGRGEDVTYDAEAQLRFQEDGPRFSPVGGRAKVELTGQFPTFAAYSRCLDRLALFPERPVQPASQLYRRWALESAGLDLALRQAGRSLGDVLGRVARPMRFCVSTGLGSPASSAPLLNLLARYPGLQFKIDYNESWTDALLAELAELPITVVDFKAHYHGGYTGPSADAARYEAVARALPDALLEDPSIEEAAFSAVHQIAAERLSWDAPVHALANVLELPATRWLNIKPSRFGLVSELLRTLELAEARGLKLYGGGQFELGCGRDQIQLLASLYYPDGPNDVAPSAFNDVELVDGLPSSPLHLQPAAGFRLQR